MTDSTQLPMETDANERPQPVELGLSSDGKREWVGFYNAHARRLAEANGDRLLRCYRKSKGAVARIALVVHLVRLVAADATLRDPTRLTLNRLRLA